MENTNNVCIDTSNDFGDIYYAPAYGKLYEAIENGEYIQYRFLSNFGTVVHPFIKRRVPYLVDGKQYYDIVTPYGYGGPLIIWFSDDSDDCRSRLMAEFLKDFRIYCHDNDIICEFIRFHTLYENALYAPTGEGGYQVINNRHTVAIDLTDPEFFSTQFDSKCRNMVRKAKKMGVATEIDPNLTTVDTFADIYYETMTKDSADDYYFFKRQYFYKIRDELADESLLVNAALDGQTVASSLFLYTPGGFAHYHLSATRMEFYKVAANNLILKVACDRLRDYGCTWLHLGGGLNSDPDNRLLAFKRSFGREDRNIKDFYIGKKVWNEDAYAQEVGEYLRAGGERNSFFPEYRSVIRETDDGCVE